MTLYEITGQFRALLNMAEDQDIDQSIISDTMEGVECEFELKADSYATIIKTLDSDSEMVKKEIERLQNRKKIIDGNIKAIKKNLENAMLVTGKTKFKTERYGFSIQKNAPSLDLVNEKKLPDNFFVIEKKLDRTALLAALKEDPKKFDGIATLKHTESLRIR